MRKLNKLDKHLIQEITKKHIDNIKLKDFTYDSYNEYVNNKMDIYINHLKKAFDNEYINATLTLYNFTEANETLPIDNIITEEDFDFIRNHIIKFARLLKSYSDNDLENKIIH